MDFWDEAASVDAYIADTAGADGRGLVERLLRHLKPGSEVLEIGAGPGRDLPILAEHFAVTASDASTLFVERLRSAHSKTDVLRLDAQTLKSDRMFDGIYSNKVLQLLDRDGLRESFDAQARLLRTGGIALHCVWYGDHETHVDGVHQIYYTASTLTEHVPPVFEVVETAIYAEDAPNDSIALVLRKVE